MRSIILALTLSASGAAFAQHDHQAASGGYAGLQARDIKALSAEQVADLREGKGMGASLPAELNGVPGPLHVLQLQDRLHLSLEQRLQLERITTDMKAQARRFGEDLIAAEGALDTAFKAGTADEAFVRSATARIAELQGQLRAVHLVAHLKTKQVMSAQQLVAYNQARGYSAQPGAHQHAH